MDQGRAVAIDAQGNVYLTGYTISLRDDTIDALLIKYTPAGELLWEKSWGRNDMDRAEAVAIDAQGNVYLAGSTNSLSKDRPR